MSVFITISLFAGLCIKAIDSTKPRIKESINCGC
jgi:hypothetical protein